MKRYYSVLSLLLLAVVAGCEDDEPLAQQQQSIVVQQQQPNPQAVYYQPYGPQRSTNVVVGVPGGYYPQGYPGYYPHGYYPTVPVCRPGQPCYPGPHHTGHHY